MDVVMFYICGIYLIYEGQDFLTSDFSTNYNSFCFQSF